MTNRRQTRALVLVTASVGIILVPFILSIAGYVLGKETEASPFLDDSVEGAEGCVEDTEYMRFHHMDMLRELRAKVVRDGKRQDVTLNTCRECHPKRETFCNRCHDAASVSLDCFGCHYYPAEGE